jgi:hypothetical protein
MDPQVAQASGQGSPWDGSLEPDVWWGEDGIDALLWADAEPYAYPLMEQITAVGPERAGGRA